MTKIQLAVGVAQVFWDRGGWIVVVCALFGAVYLASRETRAERAYRRDNR